ncbi:MAG: hypothetical protein COV44_01760 [Deltaproteobacteria bacterium CG11_big_fil_rev_8_21_14_0_20_45_16]|nr:MAG: hypothetical protein COV44_01760 [Deltaproteobacteria bacterium CG11_big_fil_rev_8_21_14_0_20_45_16]
MIVGTSFFLAIGLSMNGSQIAKLPAPSNNWCYSETHLESHNDFGVFVSQLTEIEERSFSLSGRLHQRIQREFDTQGNEVSRAIYQYTNFGALSFVQAYDHGKLIQEEEIVYDQTNNRPVQIQSLDHSLGILHVTTLHYDDKERIVARSHKIWNDEQLIDQWTDEFIFDDQDTILVLNFCYLENNRLEGIGSVIQWDAQGHIVRETCIGREGLIYDRETSITYDSESKITQTYLIETDQAGQSIRQEFFDANERIIQINFDRNADHHFDWTQLSNYEETSDDLRRNMLRIDLRSDNNSLIHNERRNLDAEGRVSIESTEDYSLFDKIQGRLKSWTKKRQSFDYECTN